MGKETPAGNTGRARVIADNRGCWHKQYDANRKPIPCRSPRCPSPWCRQKYAEKEAAILDRCFAARLPHYSLTLKITDDEHTSDRMMASYLKPFFQRFRDHRKKTENETEYDARLHFDRHGQPHVHVTLRGGPGGTAAEVKKVVREWWAKACRGRPVSVYCAAVHNPAGWAQYVTKNIGNRRGFYTAPEDWNGRQCRQNWYSQGFYGKSKDEVWKEAIAEWRLRGWSPAIEVKAIDPRDPDDEGRAPVEHRVSANAEAAVEHLHPSHAIDPTRSDVEQRHLTVERQDMHPQRIESKRLPAALPSAASVPELLAKVNTRPQSS